MYFPAEHLLDKLQISATQLEDFEKKGIVQGVSKAGRRFLFIARHVLAQGDPEIHEPWGFS